jgi:hypothetical protein
VVLRTVAFQHFHVSGVGRGTVEGFGAEMRAAHFLGEIGVFDGREAVPALRSGEPEIPQAALARLALQLAEDFALPRGECPAVALLADFAKELRVERDDLFTHHAGNAFMDRLQPFRHAKGHLRHPTSPP